MMAMIQSALSLVTPLMNIVGDVTASCLNNTYLLNMYSN